MTTDETEAAGPPASSPCTEGQKRHRNVVGDSPVPTSDPAQRKVMRSMNKRLLFITVTAIATGLAVPVFAQTNGSPHTGSQGQRRPGATRQDQRRPGAARDDQRQPGTARPTKDADGESSAADPQRKPRRTGQKAQARQEKLEELKAKEAAGTLSSEEKTKLEKLRRLEERHEKLDQRVSDRRDSRDQRARQSRAAASRAAPNAAQTPATREEFTKHAERLAKLERARDLAEADERDDLVLRVDKLIAQENARHEKWLADQKETK